MSSVCIGTVSDVKIKIKSKNHDLIVGLSNINIKRLFIVGLDTAFQFQTNSNWTGPKHLLA